MIKEGSLPHNRCYPIKGPKRRADYESTVKERIYRSYFFAVQKSYLEINVRDVLKLFKYLSESLWGEVWILFPIGNRELL